MCKLCKYTVIPWQIIKWSHAEAGYDRSLPLLGQQLLPYTFLGSQWLLHLMGVKYVSVKITLLISAFSTRQH